MQLFQQHPDGSYRACNAIVIGDVKVGAQSNFWFNCVVRGDVAPIVIGQRVNIQDAAIIHCDFEVPNHIEDDVSIGHGAIVHGAFVGRGTLVGMRATLLARTRVGTECLIAAGAVVTPDTVIPDRHLAAGIPAKIVRPLTDKELTQMKQITLRYLKLSEEYVSRGMEHPGPQAP